MRKIALWLGDWLLEWGFALNPDARVPLKLEGKFLSFRKEGDGVGGMGHWDVLSRRGGFVMGWVDWSPQWRAYHFRPHPEAVYNGGSVSEIYAFLRDIGHEVGRFV